MGLNAKKIFSIITVVAIVGVTVYTIKKYYDAKKENEQSIGLEEAKRIVEDGPERDPNDIDINDVKTKAHEQVYYNPSTVKAGITVTEHSMTDEQMADVIIGSRELADWNASFSRPIAHKPGEAPSEEDEDEDEDPYEGPDPQDVQDGKGYFEGSVDEELRYEPNSVEARDQFVNMELAVLGRDNDTRDVVGMLYDHPFQPTCDEDVNLQTRLIDHRIKFFGPGSRWTKEVSFGDVLMYYGKQAEYHVGNDTRYWVDYFLTCADINNIMLTSEEFGERISQLNVHKFYNEELQSNGLFGLTNSQMATVIEDAKARIDGCVTYDLEFHQFMQGAI